MHSLLQTIFDLILKVQCLKYCLDYFKAALMQEAIENKA
jgi:hypothetical protein